MPKAFKYPLDTYDQDHPPDNRNERRPYAYFHENGAVYRGWNAIARALGVSVTTVKRYHEVFGLPVVRLVGKRVMTTQGNIDNWIARLANVERRLIREVREKGYGKEYQQYRYRVAEIPEEELGRIIGRRQTEDVGEGPEEDPGAEPDSGEGDGAARDR